MSTNERVNLQLLRDQIPEREVDCLKQWLDRVLFRYQQGEIGAQDFLKQWRNSGFWHYFSQTRVKPDLVREEAGELVARTSWSGSHRHLNCFPPYWFYKPTVDKVVAMYTGEDNQITEEEIWVDDYVSRPDSASLIDTAREDACWGRIEEKGIFFFHRSLATILEILARLEREPDLSIQLELFGVAQMAMAKELLVNRDWRKPKYENPFTCLERASGLVLMLEQVVGPSIWQA